MEFISYNIIKNDTINPDTDRIRNTQNESSMRSKKMIIDYALCNEWNYFITITIDPKKHNRTDYKEINNKLTKYLQNYKTRKDTDFQYILIHELHKKTETDGKKAIHYHGLFKINNKEFWNLKLKSIRDQAHIYRSKNITDIFGKQNEFTLIYNKAEFLGLYISKYIAKNVITKRDKLGRKIIIPEYERMILPTRYTTSRNLKKPDKELLSALQENNFYNLGLQYTYKNDFCYKYKMSLEEYEKIKKYI